MTEKTEKATQHKLKKAREQGQVAKSPEMNSVIVSLVFLGLFEALWHKDLSKLSAYFKKILLTLHHDTFSIDFIQGLTQFLGSAILSMFLPVAITLIIAFVLANLVQSGAVFSTSVLTPDFKRLNPVNGFKKIYSIKMGFDAIKNMVKLTLVFIVVLFTCYHQMDSFLSLSIKNQYELPRAMFNLIETCLLNVLATLLGLALIDVLFTRWHFAKNQKMSKQEVKDEHKQREGDPKIKQKIRQLQVQFLGKLKALSKVKHADVIVTNPTHLAIALKYQRGQMPAPKVLCKGQDKLALKIRKLAIKHRIPIIEHKALARALYHSVDNNQWIQSEHFAMAAEVFRHLYVSKGVSV